MARVLITGSTDGLGLMAGQRLLAQGHEVTFHARSERRADDLRRAVPAVGEIVVADLGSLAQTSAMAEHVNRSGRYDAVIHNAGLGYLGREQARQESVDGCELTFAVNVLAHFVLTALMDRPGRLVYISSGLHRKGTPNLDDVQWTTRPWDAWQAYADTKLFDLTLAFAIAARWPGVPSNGVGPGWVATKMGGAGAHDDLAAAPVTQSWLAVSDDPAAKTTGGFWYHERRDDNTNPAASDPAFQDELLDYCASLSGVKLPG